MNTILANKSGGAPRVIYYNIVDGLSPHATITFQINVTSILPNYGSLTVDNFFPQSDYPIGCSADFKGSATTAQVVAENWANKIWVSSYDPSSGLVTVTQQSFAYIAVGCPILYLPSPLKERGPTGYQ